MQDILYFDYGGCSSFLSKMCVHFMIRNLSLNKSDLKVFSEINAIIRLTLPRVGCLPFSSFDRKVGVERRLIS